MAAGYLIKVKARDHVASVNTTLANRILSLCEQEPITDFDENVARAYPVRLWFDGVRDMLQREYQWNFLMARKSLPADAIPPAFGYLYQYTLPSDYLRIISIKDQTTYAWAIEGRKILTDNPAPIKVRYVRFSTLPGEWDALFTDLFVYEVAQRAAPKLAADEQAVARIERQLENLRGRAERIDAAEVEGDDPDYNAPSYPWLGAYDT